MQSTSYGEVRRGEYDSLLWPWNYEKRNRRPPKKPLIMSSKISKTKKLKEMKFHQTFVSFDLPTVPFCTSPSFNSGQPGPTGHFCGMYGGTVQKPFAGQPGQLAVCPEAQPKNKILDIAQMRVPRECARLSGKRALCPEAQPTRPTCAVPRGKRLACEILDFLFSSPTMKSISLG